MLKTPTNGIFSPNIDNPQNGDTLVYNSSTGKWENGSGGGSLVVTVTGGVYDKTWQEIHDALAAGMYCVIVNGSGDLLSQQIIGSTYAYDEDDYRVYGTSVEDFDQYIASASSANGYPERHNA